VKTSAKVLAAYRADANHRDAHERLAEVDPEEFLALLDDLDEVRECLRLAHGCVTGEMHSVASAEGEGDAIARDASVALDDRIAAALKEPHAD
jgi:hypothetical protein